MTAEEEIYCLRGEAIAAQMVLMGIGIGLVNLGPPFKTIVEQAFDNADHVLNVGIDKLGGATSKIHLESAYSVLEQLRAAMLGGQG